MTDWGLLLVVRFPPMWRNCVFPSRGRGHGQSEADQLLFISVTLAQSLRLQLGHLAPEASSGPGLLGHLLFPGDLKTRVGPHDRLSGPARPRGGGVDSGA